MMPDLEAQIATIAMPLAGWCEIPKSHALADTVIDETVRLGRALTVVELGVYGGRSFLSMALALKATGRGKCYGVDPMRIEACLEGHNDPANDEWWRDKADLDGVHTNMMRVIWEQNLQSFAIPIRARSQDVVDLFPAIDVFHIDACHSEEASTRDVGLYLPLVRPGGIVIFDDAHWQTTKAALMMVSAECEIVRDEGAWVVFRKR